MNTQTWAVRDLSNLVSLLPLFRVSLSGLCHLVLLDRQLIERLGRQVHYSGPGVLKGSWSEARLIQVLVTPSVMQEPVWFAL